ncbi:hypothetical protein [Undibacterium umbellatum]|uniref:Transposase n=1 Tax=Undibacterium umbellatum TaxID=2762300 RepID=A0ABR6Z399_9BURK|nr:hypothetical protein [Undibacterium umbellatum]MBC3906244.1 hypothetical protein [Undibacterium umbellatum]
MIISKDRITRKYQEVAQQEPPDVAVQHTAEKLGIPVNWVTETIKEQEQPA